MKKTILSLFLAVLLFVGCKPLKETVYVDRWHEKEVIKEIKDSVYVSNTDTVEIEKKGDTIRIKEIKWRISYKEKIKSDTLKIDKTANITKTVTVTKLKKDFFWYAGLFGIIAIFAWLIIKFKKYTGL